MTPITTMGGVSKMVTASTISFLFSSEREALVLDEEFDRSKEKNW